MDLSRYISKKDPSKRVADKRLNIIFASSEVAPFSKSGGLGDVAAALPRALAQRDHNVVVLTPLYGHLDPEEMRLSRRLRPLEVPRKSKHQAKVEATMWEARLGHGVRIVFIEAEDYFGRDGLYGYDDQAFDDNADRFAFFSRAVVEFTRTFALPVDVLHCNDWHTALAPIYAKHYYDDEFRDTSIVMTIHNLAYQGQFDASEFEATGLPQKYADDSELYDEGGAVNYLKGGLLYADHLTTVSPGYADEIQTEEGGFGLHEILKERSEDLEGILNGADYSIWAPDVDRHISVKYDIDSLNGKRRNKAELQHQLGLPVRPTLPMLGVISRLTEQKGIDVLVPTIGDLLASLEDERDGFQLVVLGEGSARFRDELKELQERFPNRVVFRAGYDEAMAHRIQAGSDVLVVPSRFEPCGLTQIYAMRYGTVPVVHATGGLADTVSDLRDDPEHGTGFVCKELTEDALAGAIERASSAYRNYRKWRPLMVRAMERDFSWHESARRYESLFTSMGHEKAAE